MADIARVSKCFKFIYCNNYTKNFKFMYCDNSQEQYITDPSTASDINIEELYRQLIEKLKIVDDTAISHQFHSGNYFDDIYNKICLTNLGNSENYHNLIRVPDLVNSCPKTLAIIYTYVYLSDIDFSSVQVKLNDTGDMRYFNELYTRPHETRKGLPIITEQGFVRASTIQYYLENISHKPLPPVIFEYENEKIFVVDGNNRIAYYLLHGTIPIIPAIIVIQNPEIILYSTKSKPKSRSKSKSKSIITKSKKGI